MKVVEAHDVKRSVMNYAFFERGHIAAVTEGLRGADVLSITKDRMAVEFEVKVSRSDLNKEFAAIKYATMTMKEDKQFAPAENGPEQVALNMELAGLKQKSGGWSKISKHEEYIDPKKYFESHKRFMFDKGYVPNYFYIVVPNKLVVYAIENLAGTGYGVIAYDGCRQENQHYGYFKAGVWYTREDHPDDATWMRGSPCAPGTCYKEISVKQKARKIHADKLDDSLILATLNRAVAENIRMLGEIITLNHWLEDAKEKQDAK